LGGKIIKKYSMNYPQEFNDTLEIIRAVKKQIYDYTNSGSHERYFVKVKDAYINYLICLVYLLKNTNDVDVETFFKRIIEHFIQTPIDSRTHDEGDDPENTFIDPNGEKQILLETKKKIAMVWVKPEITRIKKIQDEYKLLNIESTIQNSQAIWKDVREKNNPIREYIETSPYKFYDPAEYIVGKGGYTRRKVANIRGHKSKGGKRRRKFKKFTKKY